MQEYAIVTIGRKLIYNNYEKKKDFKDYLFTCSINNNLNTHFWKIFKKSDKALLRRRI